ncbi:endonuclease/exonuclease/phosphatase family protein, putative [Plasmodium chabaudi chabaudi]|uniref:Endonuclease/exonuclease/phosphatase family protein, putative n=1 Tax=Plasmodium chabaudi chabaudi TaxID=31271 RepID=A0A1C6YEP0_PLACU|nr:endonuclease/exonuclease/phosphatase family protein, putative [Plasmodium chabaudi chabaudi]
MKDIEKTGNRGQNKNNDQAEKGANGERKTVFTMRQQNNDMKNYPLHKYRSRSESHGNVRSRINFMENLRSRNEKNISSANKENQKNEMENLSILGTKGGSKYNNKEKGYIRNYEKAKKKNDKKNVVGYNYFTNRQQMVNSENIIKNVPISIYVGTWNCEYSDFTKGYEYEKKRYTTNYLSESTKDDLYSIKLDDRYMIRSVTPLIYIDPTIKENKNGTNENYDDLINFKLTNKNVTDQKGLSKHGDISNRFSNIPEVDKGKCEVKGPNQNGCISRGGNIITSAEGGVKRFENNIDYCIRTPNKQIYPKNNPQYDQKILNTSNIFSENSIKRKTIGPETSINNYNKISEKKINNLQNYKSQETEIFSHWISPYYDIYVICLQESISDSIIECLSMYLKEINQETYEFLPLADYKLSGYGDGAFLQMKSTTIAAWVRKSKLHPKGPVKLCASKTIAFNKLNNSKGCVSILLNIFNQFVLFIGCHMPAKDQELRQKSREFILTKLSEYFSNKATSNFKDVFHHVIWMGDFNFRVHGIQVEKVVHYLKTNNLKELLKYDEANSPYSYDLSISFQEQPINFLPTYKKNGNRPIIDKSDTKWVEKEYKLIHNIKWYKGGKQEPRIPSWTDRVFKWSCDKTQNCLTFVPNTYISPIPKEKCILMCSDHSPVSCCFQMYKMTNEEDIPSTKSIWKF